MMSLQNGALKILEETSRTFFVPIARLPQGLQEAVTSAYLSLRAIDEIEDHPKLDRRLKIDLLKRVSLIFQGTLSSYGTDEVFSKINLNTLPEVTTRIGEWALLAPESVAPRIWDTTATMAERMAYWAEQNWQICTETDLDRYTFGVAGAVGLLLSDLWGWYDGTRTNRMHAIGFGRGLQAVNILRNRVEDLARGVDFFPDGWSNDTMQRYARRYLALADSYMADLPPGPAWDFCEIPLALAYATLDAIAQGKRGLNRVEVLDILARTQDER